jgi:hypothetical protein
MATVHVDVPQALRELQSGVQNLTEQMNPRIDKAEPRDVLATDFSEVIAAIEKHRSDISSMFASAPEKVTDFSEILFAMEEHKSDISSMLASVREEIHTCRTVNPVTDSTMVHVDVAKSLRELQGSVQDVSERISSLSGFSEVVTAIETHRVDISIMLASIQELARVILGGNNTSKNSPDEVTKENASKQEEVRMTKALSALDTSEIDFTPVIDVIRENHEELSSSLQEVTSHMKDFRQGPRIPPRLAQKEVEETDMVNIKDSREVDFSPVMDLMKEHEHSLASVLEQIMYDIQDVKSCRLMHGIEGSAATQKDVQETRAVSALQSNEVDLTQELAVIKEHEEGVSTVLERIMSDMKDLANQRCPFDISEVSAELRTLNSNFLQFATDEAKRIVSFSEVSATSQSQLRSIIADMRHLKTDSNLTKSSKEEEKECLALLQTSVQSQLVDCLPGCTNPKLGKHHGKCPNHPDNQEGATVEIYQLSGDLNGRRGKLNNYDFANDRWNVNVQGSGMIPIKSGNLRICLQELQKLTIGT